MDAAEKIRDNRVRRMLARQGYTLSRSRRRDQRATDYGRYTISRHNGFAVATGCTLDDAELWALDEAEPGAPGAWETVGEICVDTGRLLLADPCYDLPQSFLDSLCSDGHAVCRPEGRPLHRNAGMAAMVETGYGDGFYPVSITRTAEGRVAAVRVDFIPPED